MSKKNIEKWSLLYWIVNQYASFMHFLFYRRIYVNNRENIPKNKPVIFALNHQNAFMDAIAIVCTTKTQPVFLARADVFSNPVTAKFLRFLKILPVFRIRDGKETVKNNEEIFQKCIDALVNKKALGIMPEGNQVDKKRLRSFKNGAFLIALKAEEEQNNQLNVNLIPVGLDYSNYHNFRSYLQISYGKPIIISDYYDLYKKDEKQGLEILRNKLTESLKSLIIHIESSRFYELAENILKFYNFRMRQLLALSKNNYPNRFKADRKMCKILNKYIKDHPSEMESLEENMSEYNKNLKLLNITNKLFEKPGTSRISLIWQSFIFTLLLPVYIYGLINNYFPFKVPIWRIRKRLKNKLFHSTFKYVGALLYFPVFYIVETIIIFLLFKKLWIRLIYIISLPISGLIYYHYSDNYKKLTEKWRYFRLNKNQNERFLSLIRLRKNILTKLDSIVEESE